MTYEIDNISTRYLGAKLQYLFQNAALHNPDKGEVIGRACGPPADDLDEFLGKDTTLN